MTQYPQNPYPAPAPRSNGLGIAGFVVSLVGLILGGTLAPIGLLLSVIALFRPPRGFAIAGTIIGLLGTLLLVAIIGFFGLVGLSCFNFARASKPFVVTGNSLHLAQQRIDDYKVNHAGLLPNQADGDALVAGLNDGWNHPIHYEIRGLNAYDVRSAGPDGTLGNADDIVVQK